MNDDKGKVVIVEDDGDSAELLARIARNSGYVAWIASDGIEALALIEEHRPHCVLLDIGLPSMDGCEVATELRRRFGDDLVLVAITGRDSDDRRVASTFALVDHYLKKPINPEVLGKILKPARS